MAWIAQLSGKLVCLDTAPIIYFIEGHPLYVETLRPFIQALDKGDCAAVTSIMTLIEVLVHPIRHGNPNLARKYRDFLLDSEGLTTILLTNDRKLPSLPGMQTLVLDDLKKDS